MEITWLGNTSFALKAKGTKLVINPDAKAGDLKADIVLSSLKEVPESREEAKIFDWPGEYEASGVPITAMRAWQKSRSKEKEEGEGEETLIFNFEVEGIKMCHLGALGHILTSETENKIGDVDILMINADKGGNLGPKKALEVIESIEPRAVILMGDSDPAETLKEMGLEKVDALDSFEIKSTSELPEDKRKYIVLNKAK